RLGGWRQEGQFSRPVHLFTRSASLNLSLVRTLFATSGGQFFLRPICMRHEPIQRSAPPQVIMRRESCALPSCSRRRRQAGSDPACASTLAISKEGCARSEERRGGAQW